MLVLFTKLFNEYISMGTLVPTFIILIGLIGGCFGGKDMLSENIKIVFFITLVYWIYDGLIKLLLLNMKISSLLKNIRVSLLFAAIYLTFTFVKDNVIKEDSM